MVVSLLLVAAAAGGALDPARLSVLAMHLNSPRKIFLGPHGTVYVAEAGTGGRARCLGTGAAKACVGLTGSITQVANGRATRVVTGLVSLAPDGEQAQGPADVVVRGGTYDVLLQNASINAHGFNGLGPDGATAGDLVSTPAGRRRAGGDVQLRRLRGGPQPRSRGRAGREVRRSADRQRSVRLHALPRRLRRGRCRRQRPPLDRPEGGGLRARRLPDADRER